MWKSVFILSSWLMLVWSNPTLKILEPVSSGNEDVQPIRTRRQSGADTGGTPTGRCEFGTNDDLDLCDWTNNNFSQLMWEASKGENSNYIGGPPVDITFDDALGGYAFIETSKKGNRLLGRGFESAMLISSKQDPTSAKGVCFKFWYNINGMSPDRLRILIHPMTQEELETDSMEKYDDTEDRVLWEALDDTMNDWNEGSLMYTSARFHQIVIEGIPLQENDIARDSRGYIAIDNVEFADPGQCGAFCTFEGGICRWIQEAEKDDFDWTLSRGSPNALTGPYRDRGSYRTDMHGGFLEIDTGYPRRPGDIARLNSLDFEATDPDVPLCMRFWTHMFGNGIGALSVIIFDAQENEDNVIWNLSGEAGNNWYQAQVPIASPNPFKIVFEGEVGRNELGKIALDDITVTQGACPSAPQVAAKNAGDCTFELDTCDWRNPVVADAVDEGNWVRQYADNFRTPGKDHTKGTEKGYYMVMPKDNIQRGGDRAWLVSPTIEASSTPLCVAFWYYIFEQFIEQSGPSLGSLTVKVMTINDNGEVDKIVPIWTLKNHQGPNWMYGQAKVQTDMSFAVIFEGMWGSSRSDGFIAIDDITFYKGDCSTKPAKASMTSLDCDFQRDACFWSNTTTDPSFRWSLSSITRRPANLPDNTHGGPNGYLFFDVFNQNGQSQTLDLRSAIMEKSDNRRVCLSFWFSAFGSGSTTILTVLRQDAPATEDDSAGDFVKLWERNAESSGSTERRTDWKFGQVEVEARSDFILTFQGKAKNGGYALDDVRVYPGGCKIRPADSEPETTDVNSEDENVTIPQ